MTYEEIVDYIGKPVALLLPYVPSGCVVRVNGCIMCYFTLDDLCSPISCVDFSVTACGLKLEAVHAEKAEEDSD